MIADVLAGRRIAVTPPHLVTVSTCYVAGNRRGAAPEEPVESSPFFVDIDWRAEVAAARRTRADTDADFFDTRGRAALAAWAWGAVPMERHKVSRRSALRSAELLEDGWSLLVFPEGGRSPDGWGRDHEGGAAYLGVRCGLPVVPIHIDGTDKVLPKGSSRPRPHRVTVTIGAPLWSHRDDDKPEDARHFARRIEAAFALLADETRSDWYSARLRAHRGASPSLKGPEIDSWRRDWALGGARVSDTDRRSPRDIARGSRPW